MRPLKEIQQVLKGLKPDLEVRYAVKDLGLFGSYLRGEADAGSDVDILVDFSKTVTLFQFARLANELSDRLGINVDLVMKDALKPGIGEYILAEVEYL